ncbi:hypothetical protein ACEPAI_8036 [Sanghuangporus weigelae]
MPDFNPLIAPLLLPLPLPVINDGNENNLGPFGDAPILQWVPWPEVRCRGRPVRPGYSELQRRDGRDPNDEIIYGPLDPVPIEVDNALEQGPVDFDINLLFDEFHAIVDEDEEENVVVYAEDAHADLVINGLFFETLEEEENGGDGDDMELDEVDSLL